MASNESLNHIQIVDNKINLLKRKLSQTIDNISNKCIDESHENLDPIKECVNFLIEEISANFMDTGFKETIVSIINSNNTQQNFDLNDLQLSPDFWDDMDFDIKSEDETIDESDVKTESSEEMTNCSSNGLVCAQNYSKSVKSRAQMGSDFDYKKDIDFSNGIKLSLNDISANWANIPINGTEMGAKILTQLDSINDSILQLKRKLAQQRNIFRSNK